MPKLLIQVLISILLASTVAYAAPNKITKETFTSQGTKRTYYLYVPENRAPASPAPLLIALHGSGRNGLSQVEQWKGLADREGFILVGPDALNPRGWQLQPDGPLFLSELIERLQAAYPINPRRVYLFGHSAGAEFTLLMGLIESEYFAALAIHAGALLPESEKWVAYAKRKLPLTIYIGTDDPIFPLKMVNETKDLFVKHGFPVEQNVLKGHDHNYYAIAAKINPPIWDFLKKHELPAAPHFEKYQFK
jgi:poly(3-hydroxybutyrate) depolymerase